MSDKSEEGPKDIAMMRLHWEQARVIWKAARRAARIETRKFQKIDAEYQKACAALGIAPSAKEE